MMQYSKDFMKRTFKKLTKDNINDVYEIEKSAFSSPWSLKMIEEEEKNELAKFYILYENEVAIGYFGILKVLDEGNVLNIAVKKEFQQKGYGNILMEKLLSEMEEENLTFLTLEVRESNLKARKLYEKFGFKIVGERKNYYDNNETAILYVRYFQNF